LDDEDPLPDLTASRHQRGKEIERMKRMRRRRRRRRFEWRRRDRWIWSLPPASPLVRRVLLIEEREMLL